MFFLQDIAKKRSEYRRKATEISPKSHWNLAEKAMESRREGNGISPKRHHRYAEETIAMRFHDGSDPVLAFYQYNKVLKVERHIVNNIPIFMFILTRPMYHIFSLTGHVWCPNRLLHEYHKVLTGAPEDLRISNAKLVLLIVVFDQFVARRGMGREQFSQL